MKNIFLNGILSLAIGLGFVACNDDDTYISTAPIITEVTTDGATVTSTTATITGTVKDLSSMLPSRYEVGVKYATSEAALPAGGTKVTGSLGEDGSTVTVEISGLQPEQQYFYCIYVTLQGKVSEYGEVKPLLTTDRTVATMPAASVTRTTSQLGGSLNNLDHLLAAGAEHGIYLSSSPDLADAHRIIVNGSENSYSTTVSGLMPNATYHYASFIEMNGNDELGDVQSFTTLIGSGDVECDDYVDMGTRYEWARFNLGAESETQLGGLYGYGDLTGLLTSTSVSSYASEDISGTLLDPAVKANAGFTPSAADWDELVKACTISEEERDGVKGMLFTSDINGNTLFFPYAGARTASGVIDSGDAGYYWTGNIAEKSKPEYSASMRLALSSADNTISHRTNGLSIRPVRRRLVKGMLACNNDKINFGHLEDNTDKFRIEIYNEYGSTKNDPPVNTNMIDFSQRIAVTFSLDGVELKSGAPSVYRATLGYASDGWATNIWTNEAGNEKCNALVSGDGTYTVYGTVSSQANGAVVFVIDIEGLATNVKDVTAVKARILSILQDAELPVNNLDYDGDKVTFGSSDNKNVNARVAVFSQYGAYPEEVAKFKDVPVVKGSTIGVEFTITGIDGNLKAGAVGSYSAGIGYSAVGWWPSAWGPFGHVGDATVTGDGTYTVIHNVEDNGTGLTDLTADIKGLYKDLVDPAKVKVTVRYAGMLGNPVLED